MPRAMDVVTIEADDAIPMYGEFLRYTDDTKC